MFSYFNVILNDIVYKDIVYKCLVFPKIFWKGFLLTFEGKTTHLEIIF